MRWGRSILAVVGPAAILWSAAVWASPEPELPVHCAFSSKDVVTITVEVDPRCFTEDPLHERYLMKVDLGLRPEEELQELKQQAQKAIIQWVHFDVDPAETLQPRFSLAFTGIHGVPLRRHDDPVVIRATWQFQRPTQAMRWRVRLTGACPYAAPVRYSINGTPLDRTSTLFAGEAAYWLDLPKR